MTSIATMIEQLEGLKDTTDLNQWENDFVRDIVGRYNQNSKRTDFFTTKVLEIIQRIWSKHFA